MKVIIIYSLDHDLSFLEPLVNVLTKLIYKESELYKLDTSMDSHLSAENAVKKAPAGSLIITLCHGGSTYILGNHDIIGLSVDVERHEFISAKNISIIENKSMICLSCNSREGFGDLVINNEGNSLIGFGDIQFDDPHKKNSPLEEVTNMSKIKMVELLEETFTLSVKSKASFFDFVNYFKLIANKKCDELILGNRGSINHLRVANFLWHLKNEIKVFGDLNSAII